MNQDEVAARLLTRLERLEDGQGFAERAAEGLSAEVHAVSRRLAEANRRLERLENAMRRLLAPGDDAGDSAPGD